MLINYNWMMQLTESLNAATPLLWSPFFTPQKPPYTHQTAFRCQFQCMSNNSMNTNTPISISSLHIHLCCIRFIPSVSNYSPSMSAFIVLLLCMWLCSVFSLWQSHYSQNKRYSQFPLPIHLATRRSNSEIVFSWNQLHEYYDDHALFAKSRPTCSCNNYLFPLKRHLFFVNEAIVSVHNGNVVYIPTDKYTSRCKGAASTFRFTRIVLGSLDVG